MTTKRTSPAEADVPPVSPDAEAASSSSTAAITRRPDPTPSGPPPGTEVRIRARLLRVRANGLADLQLLNGGLIQIPADLVVED